MPATLHQLEDENILVAKLSGHVTVDDARYIFKRSAEIMGDSQETFFRITDTTDADSGFAEMMAIIKAASEGQAGSTTDTRIQTVFVGNNQWVQLMRTALHLKQFGGKEIPMFLDMHDALTYVHMEQGIKKK